MATAFDSRLLPATPALDTPVVETTPAPTTLPLDSQRAHPGDRVTFVLWAGCVALMASMLLYDAVKSLL
jgi:hypothetical protein